MPLERMMTQYRKRQYKFIIWSIGIFCQLASALAAGAELDDCRDLIKFDVDGQLLTRTEIIAILDDRFYDSLAAFSECMKVEQSGASSASGGMSGTGANAMNNQDTGSGSESTPVSSVQGTEIQQIESATVDQRISETPPDNQASQGKVNPNGKIPDDILSFDNESVLAAQIRNAAMAETDPIKKEKLWNEYRKFRGLPQKTVQN